MTAGIGSFHQMPYRDIKFNPNTGRDKKGSLKKAMLKKRGRGVAGSWGKDSRR